jgi:hypothetical protein
VEDDLDVVVGDREHVLNGVGPGFVMVLSPSVRVFVRCPQAVRGLVAPIENNVVVVPIALKRAALER